MGVVREVIASLEKTKGKMVSLEDVSESLSGKVDAAEVDEIIGKMLKSGDLFRPKRGFIQRM
jgi:DNA replicative helicase MCM subunit Mcm2 (Cdc46/Mcm family)